MALMDFNKAIEIDTKYRLAYYFRGHIKYTMGDKSGAIIDWEKAMKLGDKMFINYRWGKT